MHESEIAHRCIEIIAKSKRLPDDAVTRGTTFVELGMDSLDKINISFEVEEAFHISIPDEALGSLNTVGDVIDGVIRLRTAAPLASPASIR
jgi:acyl carrier protein